MKKIFTFAFALVCGIAANAQTQTVTLSGSASEVTPVVVEAGKSVKSYVHVTGAANFAGFQTDLCMPEGVEVVGAKESTLTTTLDDFGEPVATHGCGTGIPTDVSYKCYRLLVSNTTNVKFTADAGSIAQVNLKVAAGFVGGSLQIKNSTFADDKGGKVKPADGPEIIIAEATGINDINANDVNAPKYNFQGIQVKDAKMFIQNGKKYIVK